MNLNQSWRIGKLTEQINTEAKKEATNHETIKEKAREIIKILDEPAGTVKV